MTTSPFKLTESGRDAIHFRSGRQRKGGKSSGSQERDRPPVEPMFDDAIAAVESMSRKIKDLARELNCLGYFDDEDDDRPRAA